MLICLKRLKREVLNEQNLNEARNEIRLVRIKHSMEVNSLAELILSTHPKEEGEIKQLFSITADFINGKATRLFFPQQLQYFLYYTLCNKCIAKTKTSRNNLRLRLWFCN